MPENLSPLRVSLLPIRTVIAVFFLFSALWSFAVPLRNATGNRSNFQPDEPNHIAVVQYIAREGALPPYTFAYYESAHPPLYHLAAAGLYRLSEPLLGADVSVHLLRLAGGCLGACVIWLVWQTALPLMGARGALLSSALAASVPMFVSLSASVSNEILAALAGAGAIAALTGGVRQRQFDNRTLLKCALWTAVGIGTKVTCLGLIPVAIGLVWIVGYRNSAPVRKTISQISLILLVAAALSGWWYARNLILYGDPLRRSEASAMWRDRIPGYVALESRGETSLPRYTARVTFWGWASFWGVFDAFGHPLPVGSYLGLAAFQGFSLYGIWLSIRQVRLRHYALLPLLVTAAPFAASVAIVYYRYTWDHYTPQGRFFFPLLLPFAVFTARGWLSLWGERGESEQTKRFLPVPRIASGVLLIGFVLLNVFVLFQAGLGIDTNHGSFYSTVPSSRIK